MAKFIPDDGTIIRLHGYEFVVRHIRIVQDEQGRDVLRFEGHCTAHPDNNDIRHTSYNGGVYGHLLGYRTY